MAAVDGLRGNSVGGIDKSKGKGGESRFANRGGNAVTSEVQLMKGSYYPCDERDVC